MKRRTSGFTLLEVTMAAAMLGVMIMAAMSMLNAGSRSFAVGVIEGDLQTHGRRALDEIASLLQDSGLVVPPFPPGVTAVIQESDSLLRSTNGSPTLTFKKNIGYDTVNQRVIYGNWVRVEVQTVPTPNGPRRSVIIRENYQTAGVPETIRVLVDNVAQFQEGSTAPGLSFKKDTIQVAPATVPVTYTKPRDIIIALTLEKRASTSESDGAPIHQTTVKTTVQLRN